MEPKACRLGFRFLGFLGLLGLSGFLRFLGCLGLRVWGLGQGYFLGHFQVGSYRYRSLIEGLFSL